MSADFKAMVAQAEARFAALSPSQQLRHLYMQRRSFVRGMGAPMAPHEEHCKNVDKYMPDEKNLTDTQIGLILAGGVVSLGGR